MRMRSRPCHRKRIGRRRPKKNQRLRRHRRGHRQKHTKAVRRNLMRSLSQSLNHRSQRCPRHRVRKQSLARCPRVTSSNRRRARRLPRLHDHLLPARPASHQAPGQCSWAVFRNSPPRSVWSTSCEAKGTTRSSCRSGPAPRRSTVCASDRSRIGRVQSGPCANCGRSFLVPRWLRTRRANALGNAVWVAARSVK